MKQESVPTILIGGRDRLQGSRNGVPVADLSEYRNVRLQSYGRLLELLSADGRRKLNDFIEAQKRNTRRSRAVRVFQHGRVRRRTVHRGTRLIWRELRKLRSDYYQTLTLARSGLSGVRDSSAVEGSLRAHVHRKDEYVRGNVLARWPSDALRFS